MRGRHDNAITGRSLNIPLVVQRRWRVPPTRQRRPSPLATGGERRDPLAMSALSFAAPAALISAALLAGCASGAGAPQCAGADWTALGLADGRAGARPKLFEQRREACAAEGVTADFSAYKIARDEGLQFYCSPAGGFAAGKSGAEYEDVCDGADELSFLESFALGERLHMLTENKEEAVRAYETAIADLDQHNYLLVVSEKRYAKPSISNEDRELERQDAEFRRREIARIESKLPIMLNEIEKTRVELEAYRVELLTMGLEL